MTQICEEAKAYQLNDLLHLTTIYELILLFHFSLSLNMPHDDDKRRCEKFMDNSTLKQNIMSRMLDHNTYPWSWSNCSRHFATEFLE